MNKLIKNIWFWAFAILLIINLTTISTIMIKMNNHFKLHETEIGNPDFNGPRPPLRFTEAFQNKIGYSEAQMNELNEIRKNHMSNMQNLKMELHQKQRDLFSEVSTSYPSQEKITTFKIQIGQLHNSIIDESIEFYANVRKISTPEQMKLLNDFFKNSFFMENSIHPRKGRGGQPMRNGNQRRN